MTLIPRVGQILTAGYMQAMTNVHGLYYTPNSTSTSATYATFGTTITYVKVDGDSQVRADMHVGCWANTSVCTGEFGLQFGSSTYNFTVVHAPLALANTRRNFSGRSLLSGIPAGSYTVSMILRRSAGAGTLTLDGNDRVSYTIVEVQ